MRTVRTTSAALKKIEEQIAPEERRRYAMNGLLTVKGLCYALDAPRYRVDEALRSVTAYYEYGARRLYQVEDVYRLLVRRREKVTPLGRRRRAA
jgi:hypothetical protein